MPTNLDALLRYHTIDMGALRWEFVQAYVITVANQNVYHWLLKRQVTDKERSEIFTNHGTIRPNF